MNLPNYFLADLPQEATLRPAMIVEACQTLKRNREQYLSGRSTESMIRTLSDVAETWLKPESPFRQAALRADPQALGFPRATVARGLDLFFRQITPDHLRRLLTQDLGHARRLDEFCASRTEQETGRAAMARAPELLVHISAGNIPVSGMTSMLLGVLVRSAQFVKCATGTSWLPRLFAHSLYEADPKLGACLEVAEWPGGTEDLETGLFSEADCVTASGSNETLALLRHQVPARARFVGYGHRVSFGYIAREALSTGLTEVIGRAVQDVVAWNQLGCLSPHLLYVERGGRISAEQLAGLLAEELAKLEEIEPRGELNAREAAAVATRRAFYEVRSAHLQDTRVWSSPSSTAWTVVYEADPRFQSSCLYRFVYVKPVADSTQALQAADSIRGQVSTIGLEAPEPQAAELARAFAAWGVTRVCPLGQMQNPPLTWRHDGRPALADLVTWTDWERASED